MIRVSCCRASMTDKTNNHEDPPMKENNNDDYDVDYREEYENIIDGMNQENIDLRRRLNDNHIKLHIFMMCNLILWRQFGRGFIGVVMYILTVAI